MQIHATSQPFEALMALNLKYTFEFVALELHCHCYLNLELYSELSFGDITASRSPLSGRGVIPAVSADYRS